MAILYITVMAFVTYLIRVIPLTFFRKKIENPYIQSFLYYVPYTCLTAMTFPAIFYVWLLPWYLLFIIRALSLSLPPLVWRYFS